jgi:tRNA-dihydrouridine synthase
MVARGAQGNPWIFSELIEYEKTGQIKSRPSIEEIKKTILRHGKLLIDHKGDYTGIREMRKHVAWYTKGMHGSARLRDEVNKVETYQGLENILTEL